MTLFGQVIVELYIVQRVGYDKAHCEASDWGETNQWVSALTLRFARITIKSKTLFSTAILISTITWANYAIRYLSKN